MNKKKGGHGNPRVKELGIATRFQPGTSGNPGGRPKTRILAEMLAAIGNEIEPKSKKTFFQVAAESLVSKVFRGDVQAFKEFADRVDGRSTQSVELSGGLQVQHGDSDWVQRWQKATYEEREQMRRELDDKILAMAERIKAERTESPDDSPETRQRNRMREFNERCEAGEDPKTVLATLKSPPVGPVN